MKNTPIALCFLALALCAAGGGANIPSHSGGALMPPTSFGVYNASDWYEPRPVAGRPGMLALKDGTVIAAPPNMQPQTSSTSCPNPHWQGNAPPSCTNSGPFRRVYAQPTENGISGYIYLPKDGQPKMPKGVGSKNNPNGDTGYIYMLSLTRVSGHQTISRSVSFSKRKATTTLCTLRGKLLNGQVLKAVLGCSSTKRRCSRQVHFLPRRCGRATINAVTITRHQKERVLHLA